MARHIGSVIMVIVGGLGTGLSWWLLLHLSDERVNHLIQPPWNEKMSKDDAEASGMMSAAWLAIVLMVMTSIVLIAGLMRLFGYG